MEPIPETVEAVEEFGPFTEGDLLAELCERAERVREIVAQCVGLSLGSLDHGVTFTLVATDVDVAALDATQYLDGGPCVEAVDDGDVTTFLQGDALDEDRWQLFAQATAARGVLSTLTLPLLIEGKPVGSVNLYASTSTAFVGHHEEIAALFDAWAPGAVTNADLSFASRAVAEQAPAMLREEYTVAIAVGFIAARDGVDLGLAHDRLHQSAQRAGLREQDFAGYLVEFARLEKKIEGRDDRGKA